METQKSKYFSEKWINVFDLWFWYLLSAEFGYQKPGWRANMSSAKKDEKFLMIIATFL